MGQGLCTKEHGSALENQQLDSRTITDVEYAKSILGLSYKLIQLVGPEQEQLGILGKLPLLLSSQGSVGAL